MWKSKKVILAALLGTLLLAGTIGGIAFAQTGNGDDSQPKALFSRVAGILGIDQQKLEDAFAQAQKEMRDEALDSYLQKAVEAGKLTQEQADQYKGWWQARPDTPLPGPFGRGFGFQGFGGGMKWGRGHNCWGGPYVPPEASGSGL